MFAARYGAHRRRIVAGMAGLSSEVFTGWATRSALGLTRRLGPGKPT